jgi:type I restriction enzyme, S subunit
MAKSKKVPELRFAGFKEEWEEYAIKEIVQNISDGDWIEADHIFENGKYRIIQTGNLGLGEYFDKPGTAKFLQQSDFDMLKANEIFPNDILISRLAEPAGRTIILPNTGFRMVTAVDIAIIRPDLNSYSSCFFVSLMNRRRTLNEVAESVAGTSHKRISRKNLEKINLAIPAILEQNQIGTFFQNLDSLISLHQRKNDKLLTVKKAMLEKMFPKEGTEVPEIRFKGFSSKWDKREIGDIISEKKRPIELEDSELYELVTVKRRNEGIVSRGMLYGKDILVKNYYRVRTGDYLISKRQIVHGANGIVPKNLDGAIVSNEYLTIIGNAFVTTNYWALFSKHHAMYRIFFISSFGVDIEKLVFDVNDWKKRTITIPSLAEQDQITHFFQRLDSLISLQARQLDKLKNIKKACLEKMFV